MWEKFGLKFEVFEGANDNQPLGLNPWDQADLWISRLDQLVRRQDLQESLQATHWDLVIFDEAHKWSATYFGNKVNETKRFKLVSCWGLPLAICC